MKVLLCGAERPDVFGPFDNERDALDWGDRFHGLGNEYPAPSDRCYADVEREDHYIATLYPPSHRPIG